MKLVNADIYKLIELIRGKKIVCFGAGLILRNFIDRYPELHLDKLISLVVDNSEKKKGTIFTYNQRELPIISVKELCKLDNIAIIITCRDVAGVYEQLEQYQELENVLCFASSYVNSETNILIENKREYPLEYKLTSEVKIPKIIHYCWFGKNPIPKQNLEWMESWKRFCPDYEIIEWNEDNYDISKNQYMYDAYKYKKWGFVSDYARLDIIHEHGGVYFDTDVELIRNIDDLLYQPAFAGVDGTRLVSLGLGFGAQKGNPVIERLKDAYENISFIEENGKLNLTPIPKLQKTLFNDIGYVNNGEYQVLSNITIYPEKVLSGKCNWTGRILTTEHTFAIHHYDGSWVRPDVMQGDIKRRELFKKLKGN